MFGFMVLEFRKPIDVGNYGLVILENQIMFGIMVLDFRTPI